MVLPAGPFRQALPQDADVVLGQAVQGEAGVVQPVQITPRVGHVLRVERGVGGVGELEDPGQRVTLQGGGDVDVVAHLTPVDQGGDLGGDQVVQVHDRAEIHDDGGAAAVEAAERE